MADSSPAVEMTDVTLMRGLVTILSHINWQLPRGAYAALLGPNGSGKTTLMHVLTGYMWPTSGSVDVLGMRLGQIDVRQLRRRVGLVDPAQRFGVDGTLTAHQAVLTGHFATLALYDEVDDRQIEHADHLLAAVALEHRRDQPFRLLSTGEQRRCLLARALVHVPELLILDEPTAGLDVSGREHLLATIDQLRKRTHAPTIIMVTHHVEEISPAADQVLLLKDGRITACGTPRRVITPETLSDLFDTRVFVQKRSGRYWLEVLPEAWRDLLNDQPPRR